MRTRKGEVATILTVATLVVVGVTAVVSSLNLNKKQTTSSRADELCKVQSCGSLSTNGAAKYYAKYISGVWKYFKDVDCKNEAIEGVGTYCKSQNYAGGNECIAKDCDAPNQAKKYYQWKNTEGNKDPSIPYSDKGVCSAKIPDKDQYCKTAGGPNVTPVPGQNPPNWGLNQGGGCGSGGANYKFGSCYKGKRCVQCQNVGTWLSYNCFEDDSSCTGDVTYCDAPWKVTTCSNGVHKCCDTATGKCIKSGNKPTDPQEDIANCIKPAEDICNAASGEYCGDAGGSCKTGDTLVSPAKICDSAANKRCCKKSNTCDGKDGYKCISSSTSGVSDDDKCKTAGKLFKTTDKLLSCGDASKICCYGTYTPPPVADGCEKITDTCPKDDGVKYEYYQSKGEDCAAGIASSRCFGVSSTNCLAYTKTEIQKYSCDTGTLPEVKCEGEVHEHNCQQYCDLNNKSSSSPGLTYAYTGVEPNTKYWTDTTCKTSFDPVAKCGCGGSVGEESNECTFTDGTKIKYRETLCKNNKLYVCSNTGEKTGPTNCSTGLVCETGDKPQKCVDMSNLGVNSCNDSDTKARTDCGKNTGDVVKTQACTDEDGWNGTSKYSIVCPSYAPWSCIYHVTHSYLLDDGSPTIGWNLHNDYSTANDAKANTVCERTPNQTRVFGVSLTVKNLADLATYNIKLMSGSICASPSDKAKTPNCTTVDVSTLTPTNDTVHTTFNVKPEDSYSEIYGYVKDNKDHVYQVNVKATINEYTPPQKGGYGLTVDIQSPST